MTDVKRHPGLDGSDSVSALGLRWAALRGMLSSPLIEADEQQALRADLVRELSAIERDFASTTSRNATEIAAKIDVAKAALQGGGLDRDERVAGILDSMKADLRLLTEQARTARPERSSANLVRAMPQQQAPAAREAETPGAPNGPNSQAAE